MTSHRPNFAPSHSSSTAYDKELWDIYVWMNPHLRDAPDAQKRSLLDEVYMISRGGRAEALQYLEYCKQAFHLDAVQVGFQCPRRNVQCKTVEFDNIKVFYHPTWPDHLRSSSSGDTWNFYIGRPGAPASQCINWAAEGIKIDACGPSGEWGECMMPMVTPGARVRITYPFRNEKRTREIVFPLMTDSSVPTTYLEPM